MERHKGCHIKAIWNESKERLHWLTLASVLGRQVPAALAFPQHSLPDPVAQEGTSLFQVFTFARL